MENNTPTPTTQPTAPVSPVVVQTDPPPGGSNKMWLIIGLVVILVLAVAGIGIYMLQASQQAATTDSQKTKSSQAELVRSFEELDKTLKSLEAEETSVDQDFTEVDADLAGL